MRQGPHQEAQKSINTTLPRSDDNLISFPSGLDSTNSGAILPI